MKGEPHVPKSLFDDIGKPFLPPKEFTPMPKDYKEYPERDLVIYIVLKSLLELKSDSNLQVNFPNPDGAFPYFAPKTRMMAFPDSWFQPFLGVTGVSG